MATVINADGTRGSLIDRLLGGDAIAGQGSNTSGSGIGGAIAGGILGVLGNLGNLGNKGNTGDKTGTNEERKPGTGGALRELEPILPLPPQEGGETEKDPVLNVQDKTNENVEQQINGTGGATQSIFDYMEQQQKKQWEREDLIRAETQQREDTAYQRAVKDMQAAGINPNLMNVQPAAAGGGITSATGMNYAPYTAEVSKQVALLEQELDQIFKEDENAKDRFTNILTDVIQSIIMFKTFKKGGG